MYELVDREHTTAFDLGESYWYAYRKREGKLTKKYLGTTAELTLARLEEVGQIVSAEPVTQASASKAFPSPLSKDAHLVKKAQGDNMAGDAELFPPSSHLSKQARDPFLVTRLQRPRLRPRLVHRSRLNQRLALVSLSTLTLISAPAGYGKTTLVSDWLATSMPEVVWLSLKPEDNDPARFWNYVIAALETLHPGVGAQAWAMLQSGGLLPFVALLTPLMNNLNQITRDFVLVLEDYHVIGETAIHEVLSFLLNNLPHTTHVVMISRTMPPLHLAHLRVRGHLLELHTSDLRFTLEESAVFFSEVMELPLSRDDLQKVEKRTEGWIAGLQLAALSMQNCPDISGFLTRFAGDHRYIFDYLIEEVLWRQPAPLQEFLLHTCILEQLSGSLCDALTGRRDSFAILTQLETAQLFLMPLDDQRRWYRYHALFADSLRAYLTQTTPELPNRLHRSASSWYEENGLLTHAIHHALQAADYERAVILVEQLAPVLLARGEVHTIFEWIESLPAEYVVTRSGLCLYGAWGYLVLGKLDHARKMLEQAELVGIEPSMRTEAAAIQIAFAPYRGNAIDATLLAREVVNEYEALNTSFKRRSLFALQGAVAVLKMQGRLRSAATICQQALAVTRGVSLDTWVGTASAFMLGDILYELNDLGAASRPNNVPRR